MHIWMKHRSPESSGFLKKNNLSLSRIVPQNRNTNIPLCHSIHWSEKDLKRVDRIYQNSEIDQYILVFMIKKKAITERILPKIISITFLIYWPFANIRCSVVLCWWWCFIYFFCIQVIGCFFQNKLNFVNLWQFFHRILSDM